MKSCESCTLCCKLMGVPELGKPDGKWCEHCSPGEGCNVHGDVLQQPSSCANFSCGWLQDSEGLFGDDLRPDRCHVMLTSTTDGQRIVAMCEPHIDPFESAMGELLRGVLMSGIDVIVIAGPDKRRLFRGNPEAQTL